MLRDCYNPAMSIQVINDVYIADTARVLGEVVMEGDVNLWYGAAVRGDVSPVYIASGTNVQDQAVIHCDYGVPNRIGKNITIGHGAIIHGQQIGAGSLIGMGATLLGRTVIGCGCLIAAGAVVPPGMVVPDGSVVMGVPGKIVRQTNKKEQDYMRWLAPHYVELAKLHYEKPNDARITAWQQNPTHELGQYEAEHPLYE